MIKRSDRLNKYIMDVAEDCVKNFNDKDKEYIIDNPCAIDYHFGYCLYIRNHYIYNHDFSDFDDCWVEPDNLSGTIMNVIISLLLTEYDADSEFIKSLYDDKSFLKLRRTYKEKFSDYPTTIILEESKRFEEELALYEEELEKLAIPGKELEFDEVWNLYYETINEAIRGCKEKIKAELGKK